MRSPKATFDREKSIWTSQYSELRTNQWLEIAVGGMLHIFGDICRCIPVHASDSPVGRPAEMVDLVARNEFAWCFLRDCNGVGGPSAPSPRGGNSGTTHQRRI